MKAYGYGYGLPFAKRRGGLSAYKSKMAFWSGDLDFDNLKWLDQTGNTTGADLVETACVEIKADVTITTTTALTGKTVAKVNESADNIAGVSVSGADLCIDFSELVVTDNKIWSIELDDGQLFILQSVASPYIFADGNMGTIGGTEDAEWSHSTSDSAFPYHLRDGFSKYPFFYNESKRLYSDTNYNIITTEPFTVTWEGCLFEDYANLFQIAFFGVTYGYAFYVRKSTGAIKFSTRTAGSVVPVATVDTSDLSGKLKFVVEYNGKGLDDVDNFAIYLNDVELTLTSGTHSYEDRTGAYYCGNGTNPPICFITNFNIVKNGNAYYAIKDGKVFEYQVEQLPDKYIYLPGFNNVDTFGDSLTNPANSKGYNYPETKIKLPVNSGISDNDINNILYTNASTPNVLELSQFSANYGDKIHCDNSKDNLLSNLVITTEAIDLYKYLNEPYPFIPIVSMRADNSGANDSQSLLYDQVIMENNAKGDAHSTMYGFNTDDEYTAAIASKKMAIGLHDVYPAFWQYATYSEGKNAYDIASTDDKTNEVVIENQGKIGYSASGYHSAKYYIEAYHNNQGIPYPDGVTPDDDDDNEMWWEWLLDGANTIINNLGGSISDFSILGTLPSGNHVNHPEVQRLIFEKYNNITPSIIIDDLAGGNSIFSNAKNASIIEDSGVNVQKLTGYGDTAYGSLAVDKGLFNSQFVYIEFMVKSIQGDAPLTSLQFLDYYPTARVTFGTNISFHGDSQVNPCTTGNWYKIKLYYTRLKREMRIENESGENVYISPSLGITNNSGDRMIINADDTDILIKDLIIKYYDEFVSIGIDQVKYDLAGYNEGDTYDEHIEKKKEETVNKLYAGSIPRLFSHYIMNPDEKAADGTLQGIHDRSYNGFTEWIQWCQTNGFSFKNTYDILLNHSYYSTTKRENLIRNGDFKTDLHGLSGQVWGWDNLTVDETETTNNSIDGSNIVKLESDKSESQNYITLKKKGIKYLRFWAKGDFYLSMNNGLIRTTHRNPRSQFTPTNYTFYCLPYNADSLNMQINITAITDSYFHKMELTD